MGKATGMSETSGDLAGFDVLLLNRWTDTVCRLFEQHRVFEIGELECVLKQHGMTMRHFEAVREQCGLAKSPNRWECDGQLFSLWTREENDG